MKALTVVLAMLVVVLGVLVLAQRHPAAPVAQVGHLTNFRNAERMQEKHAQGTAVEQTTERPPK